MGKDSGTVQEDVYYRGYLAGYRDIYVTNPYKTEDVTVGGRNLKIVYYYASLYGMQMGFWDRTYTTGTVREDFLTPLVFENGKLRGWGWEYVFSNGIKKREKVDQMKWMLMGS